jgi:hypothetical protein
MEVYYFGFSDAGSRGFRWIADYFLVFKGCRKNVLQDFGFQLDLQGLDSQVFRISWIYGLSGLSDFRVFNGLDLVSVDLRILV